MSTRRHRQLEDDGLAVDRIGEWSREKHRLIAAYAGIFSTGMKKQWEKLVYLDLYTGPGRARIKGSDRLVETSPVLSLRVRDPFSRYIFCDKQPEFLRALRTRAEREFPERDARYLHGDCNDRIDNILSSIPRHRPGKRVLSLAFLDPRNLNSLKFSTIEALSAVYVDFVVLLASNMDGHRNQDRYTRESDSTIDNLLGDPTWRPRWAAAQLRNEPFRRFLELEFAASMERLGYLPESRQSMIPFRDRGRDLYNLAFFSRNKRGYRFWNEVRSYATGQRELF